MVKNQHFLPQFYQRFWESEHEGCVYVISKKTEKQVIRWRAIRKNCSYEFLYEFDAESPDNIFETKYGEFENKYAPMLKRFIDARYCFRRLSDENKEMICKIYGHLSARNMKNVYFNFDNLVLASYLIKDSDDKEFDQRLIFNVIAAAESGLNSEGNCRFANELMKYNIQILVSDKNDIIFTDSIIRQVHGEDEYFFPLCSSVVALFTKAPTLEDKVIRRITQEEYKRFVDMYLKSRYTWEVYAAKKDVLEQISKEYEFGLGRWLT